MLRAAPPPQTPSQPPHKAAPAQTYFSGTVTDFNPGALTVVRKQPAKDPITRTFALDGKTTTEGNIHMNARVTVRYSVDQKGAYHAIHIIVRQ